MIPLYIIPARGGSKGIPRKNIKPFARRPLIAYSIDAALAMGDGTVLVSTDDEEIAQVAADCGAPTPYRRPAEFATDKSGSREVMLDAMDWADAHGIKYDCVVLLQPTSPLRTPEDIRACLDLYEESHKPGNAPADMVVSVMPAKCNPYYDCFEADPTTGNLHVSKGDGLYTRRQDAPPAYQYNGSVYVINPASLRRYPLGALPLRLPYLMPSSRSLDIDSPLEWSLAEALISKF